MNIGIDIDGVLTELEKTEIECGIKMCIEENIPINLNLDEYRMTEKFSWTNEQEDKFWNKYWKIYLQNTIPRTNAGEILKKLKKEGNNIYIITARNEYGLLGEDYGKCQEYTKQWLEKNKIIYDKIFFTTDKEKLLCCKENGVSIMVEDSPKNIIHISTEVPVIRFHSQYNQNIKGENIKVAYTWEHVYDIINKEEIAK